MKWMLWGSVLLLWASSATAQTTAEEEYSERIRAATTVEPLTHESFGAQVNLYNGSTEFSVVDVSLPGNDALAVEVRRHLPLEDKSTFNGALGGFGDWSLDVPYIHGLFAADKGWKIIPGDGYSRCSVPAMPDTSRTATPSGAYSSLVWDGYQLNIPGSGSQELLVSTVPATPSPSSGGPYPWLTKDHYRVSCLPAAKNYPGEAFVVLSPNGIKYTLDHAIVRAATSVSDISRANTKYASGYIPVVIPRSHIYFVATKAEDRFGNTMQYHYVQDELRQITSSDGRSITLNWSGGKIVSITSAAGTWHYAYRNGAVPYGLAEALDVVTRPDNSSWQYSVAGDLVKGAVFREDGAPPLNMCQHDLDRAPSSDFFYTVRAPWGAQATYRFAYTRHWRTYIPTTCVETLGGPRYPDVFGVFHQWSLQSLQVTGPGLAPMTWTYHYDTVEGTMYYRAPWPEPNWPTTTTYVPGGTCATCPVSKTLLVKGPTETMGYEFGIQYARNEGRLLSTSTATADGVSVLRTVTNTYLPEGAVASHPFPDNVGKSLLAVWQNPMTARVRPIVDVTTSQDGVNAVRSHQSFDVFARPLSILKSNTQRSRTDTIEYHDDLALWVLGQVSRSTVDGQEERRTTYGWMAHPTQLFQFGKLRQALTYNTDGTIASIADGNNNVTTLDSWKRGIPRSIQYPATAEMPTGSTQSAVVNDAGWITQVADENSFVTSYTHDAMGRLASIIYPTGDTTAWNTTTQVFEPVAASEYDIAAGHWRQTVSTGNARKVSYFDALWRPLVTREYDTADASSTQRFNRFAYDHAGRTTFASYAGTTHSLSTGTWTEYDALGRVTSVSQDSEQGPLTTSTQYLAGLQTKVTNPRNQVTLTGYQIFDQPSYDAPVWVQHPEDARTDIARDVFGKPTALTRRDAGNTQLVTRHYVYDAYQQLCKAVEPETGATVMDYDNAGNLQWSAAGLTLTSISSCDTLAGRDSGRKVTRLYDSRNRLEQLLFPDSRGNQSWSYTADGLPASITTFNSNGGEPVVNSYSYNKRRLLTSESVSQPGYTWTLGYQYDGNGALTNLTYPSGLQVAFAPNALGQPTQAGPYATGVSYYPNGALQQFTYGNGIVHSMTQNARQLPLRVQSGNATGYEYAYDRNGNPAQIHDLVRGTNYSRTLQYDGLDRLTAAGSAMFGGDHWHRFTYDALDNLTSWKLTGVKDYASYYYEPTTNRLLSIQNSANAAIVGLGYDLQGNLDNKNGQQYAFDYGNRLREAANKETYRYDGHGRRVQATTPAQVPILSMYGQDGTLRRQEDHRTGKHYEYVTLAGSLVAKVTTVVAPGTPSLTTPGYSSNGSYSVSWTAVATATSYELQEAANGGSWAAAYSGANTSHGYSGKAGGTYQYRARACQASSCSSWSNTGTTTVELPPASAPNLSVPASAPNGTYTVSWSAVGGATSYNLEESANGGSWASVQNTASQSRAYSGKAAGSYSYRVQACNPTGCGPTSATATAQTLYPPAIAPSLTVPASSYTGAYTVSWTAVGGATSYQLEEQVGSGSWSLVHNAAGSSLAIGGRTAGSYSYRVKPCNTVGCGPLTAVQTVQVTLPPTAAPTVSAPASNVTGSYTVSWTGVGAATSYHVWERVNGGGWSSVHDAAATSLVASGKANATYGYIARGCNVAECGPWSAEVSTVVNVPPAIPATPTGLSAFRYWDELLSPPKYVADVYWNAAYGATYYELREQKGTSAAATVYNGAATQVTRVAVGTGALMYWVRACSPNGCSAWSAGVSP